MYWLFMYASKYIFSQMSIVKRQSETCEILDVPEGCVGTDKSSKEKNLKEFDTNTYNSK